SVVLVPVSIMKSKGPASPICTGTMMRNFCASRKWTTTWLFVSVSAEANLHNNKQTQTLRTLTDKSSLALPAPASGLVTAQVVAQSASLRQAIVLSQAATPRRDE